MDYIARFLPPPSQYLNRRCSEQINVYRCAGYLVYLFEDDGRKGRTGGPFLLKCEGKRGISKALRKSACENAETREPAQGRDVDAKEHTLLVSLEIMYKYSIGTDGFRVLCHQFSLSSLPRQEDCIRRCNACLLKTTFGTGRHPLPAVPPWSMRYCPASFSCLFPVDCLHVQLHDGDGPWCAAGPVGTQQA
jgi:hypothetical protein